MNKTAATAGALIATGAMLVLAPTVSAQPPAASVNHTSAHIPTNISAPAHTPRINGTSEQLQVSVNALVFGRPSVRKAAPGPVAFRIPVLSTRGATAIAAAANQPGVSCTPVSLTPGAVAWVNCSGTATRGVLRIALTTAAGQAQRTFTIPVR